MSETLRINGFKELKYDELYEIDAGGFWKSMAMAAGTVLVAAAFVMCASGIAALATGATAIVLSAKVTVTAVGMICAGVEAGLTGAGLISCY